MKSNTIYNPTNFVWQEKVSECVDNYDNIVKPRGMEVKEVISSTYTVSMPAFLDLADRKINLPFMFAEAAWIVSGSNRLARLTPYMKAYKKFSDDGVFLRGAYGPKVVDQLGYVVDTLVDDNDSRQAVISIWRERPAQSKDIPCTINMQFFIRDKQLHMVTNMRSQDIILGFTYDVFTFSMVAKAVQLLLKERDVFVTLGDLHVHAGSLHIYKEYYDEAEKWLKSKKQDPAVFEAVAKLAGVTTYENLVEVLTTTANELKD